MTLQGHLMLESGRGRACDHLLSFYRNEGQGSGWCQGHGASYLHSWNVSWTNRYIQPNNLSWKWWGDLKTRSRCSSIRSMLRMPRTPARECRGRSIPQLPPEHLPWDPCLSGHWVLAWTPKHWRKEWKGMPAVDCRLVSEGRADTIWAPR